MFQFGGFPMHTYVFSMHSMVLHHGSFLIRKSTGRSLFAAHRSLSQLVTSFFGSWCQGIHLVLLLAWTSFQTVSCSLFRSQKNRLSFANNCYGCCYLLFLPQCDKIAVFYSRFGKTNVCSINLLLNYLFVCFRIRLSMNICESWALLVGTSGLEPPTSRLSAECSSQLS